MCAENLQNLFILVFSLFSVLFLTMFLHFWLISKSLLLLLLLLDATTVPSFDHNHFTVVLGNSTIPSFANNSVRTVLIKIIGWWHQPNQAMEKSLAKMHKFNHYHVNASNNLQLFACKWIGIQEMYNCNIFSLSKKWKTDFVS